MMPIMKQYLIQLIAALINLAELFLPLILAGIALTSSQAEQRRQLLLYANGKIDERTWRSETRRLKIAGYAKAALLLTAVSGAILFLRLNAHAIIRAADGPYLNGD